MTQIAPTNSTTEQARLELGIAAIDAERRNRPRWLLWAGGLLVAVALVYAYTGLRARGEASARLDRTRQRHAGIVMLINDINRLKAEEASRGLAPNNRVASDLEKLASAVDLKLTGSVSESDNPNTGIPGMVTKEYAAKIDNEDPKVLFRWLNAVRTSGSLLGVELSGFKINPAAQGYSCEVRFRRWEKRS